MPVSMRKTRSSSRLASNDKKKSRTSGGELSLRTKKQIESLPKHAQHIYEKAHASALEQYRQPEKRRGGKTESREEVAHKVAWAAVKRKYKKEGDRWIKK